MLKCKQEDLEMIKARPLYLNRLIEYQGTEFIKVLTGVRRCGKSYVLTMFHEHLLEAGIDPKQILYINFEHPDSESLKTAPALNDYIKSYVANNNKNYFLFDEIQEVDSWERVINGLRVAYDSDIYITGSNAKILSGELATLLSGRYVEIKIMPLSFVEFCDFKSYHDGNKLMQYYQKYMEIGSLPPIVLLTNENLIDDVASSIFDSIILKDVSIRGDIKDIALLQRVIRYLLDQIGNTVSPASIANTLSVSGRKTTGETVDKYLSLLEDAYILYKADRYDIRGKERLKTLNKYYVVDLGLRNAILGRNRGNHGAQLENIVFLELIRRGYDVAIGKLGDKEIDFVCRNVKETLYVQVTHQLPDNSKRETDNLLHIPDAYRKIIVSGNPMDAGIVDGIEIIPVTEFLLGVGTMNPTHNIKGVFDNRIET